MRLYRLFALALLCATRVAAANPDPALAAAIAELAAVRDPACLEDMKKIQTDIDPVSADEIARIARDTVEAPPGIPADRAKALQDAFMAVFKDPKFIEQLNAQGVDSIAEGPDKFGQFIAAEIPLWTDAVKRAGVTL